MAELRFDLRLTRGSFTLEMAAEIPAEGVTAVVGPSGSGKTTLLSALAGLERGVEGRARLADNVWMEGPLNLPPRDRRIGFVFQDRRLFDHMSVADNIAYGAKRRGVPAGTIHALTEALGLGGLLDRRPHTLSGGEARRVSVARAMASAPDILFMDEPLAGLDDDAKAQVLPYISRLVAESGVPVLYVTHSMAEVSQLADRILQVSDGRIRGWAAPPATLAVTVIEEQIGGHLLLELGSVRFTLIGHGRPGDARRIAVPEQGIVLSRQHPGESAALSVLQARTIAVSPRPGGASITVRAEAQDLSIDVAAGSALADRPPREGETLWLSLLRAHLR
ncbi:MAG: ATP-binding cassette domain-containing protein [Rhodobacteraceae bacterium]|nr:ATP-binding cassette domain-containing protein [Alphaproteobacteria bacterium]MBT8474001.1 ATP-binding cassette domain-containing protein [Alphaproteobacteria bacterium]NNK65686.1 ATP-binding cassette domain-containing protein [Paracoccaceae bacterium]